MGLAACAGPQTTRYYILPDSVFRQPANGRGALSDRPDKVLVSIERSRNNHALIYRTSPVTVHFAKNAFWAEPLDKAAANAFANALNEQSAGTVYLPNNSEREQCPCIRIDLQAFHGAYTGAVTVAGVAHFLDESGKTVDIKPFAVEQPQQGDGYEAMTRALGLAIKQAAGQIAR